jgi:ketosteroid isomerase-like protein
MDANAMRAVVERFLSAFNAADLAGMRSVLDDELVAYTTNATGGETRVDGADNYVGAISAMDLPAADFTVAMTQQPVLVDNDRVLIMVEVRARRGTRRLHNFAAHLVQVREGRITQMRMVEAKPADSDAFWSQ